MQSRLHGVGRCADQAHIAQSARTDVVLSADFHCLIGLMIGAGWIEHTRIRGLLIDARRLAEVSDVGLVVVERIAGLVVERFRLVRTARTEYGKWNVAA